MRRARRCRGWRRATLLAALALLGTLPAAAPAGAEGGRHPSARALWHQYPLRSTAGHATAATVTPSPAAAAPASPASPPAAPAAHTSVAVWVVLILVAAMALVGVWMLIRARRTTTARVEPEIAAAATTPPGPPSAVPPAPEQSWTAQVEWRGTGRHCTFCVVATTADAGRTATLPASPLIEWPPADASAVRAMTEAVSTLEVSLLAAGWSPLPPGDAWFAKRFAWRPRAEQTSTPKAAARPRRAARARVRSARLGTGGPDTT